mmetsp:Transcript_6910/g.12054  ORF Transcript_6910/g.12054 Transcript_6910/m.12054 type:complete len:99 (-) Transcript_6910:248-544(-)
MSNTSGIVPVWSSKEMVIRRVLSGARLLALSLQLQHEPYQECCSSSSSASSIDDGNGLNRAEIWTLLEPEFAGRASVAAPSLEGKDEPTRGGITSEGD